MTKQINSDLCGDQQAGSPDIITGLQAWHDAAIAAGLQDAEAGRVVADEHVGEWIDSWGSTNELPKPQCD